MKNPKLGDIGDIPIRRIKVKLPEHIYNCSSLTEKYYNIGDEVWLLGPHMGDWFVKKEPDESKVYPLFTNFIPWDELKEWEVLEIAPEKKEE